MSATPFTLLHICYEALLGGNHDRTHLVELPPTVLVQLLEHCLKDKLEAREQIKAMCESRYILDPPLFRVVSAMRCMRTPTV